MKKYIQGCEIGGSIYGKQHSDKKNPREKREEKEDLTGSYKKLYRNQVIIMNKVFRQDS